MKNIVIIGGGIMGLSSAWRLAQAGHQVTVLEKHKCGDGSTCASLGALVPYNPWREDELPTIQRESLWMYPSFIKELFHKTGIDVGYKRLGRLQIIQSPEQHERLRQGAVIANKKWPSTHSTSPTQKIVDIDELKILEPELEPTPYGALLCHATAQFEPKRMIAALRSACLKTGVDIRENSPAIQIMLKNGLVYAVHSATGMLPCSHVILAAGAWSSQLLPSESQYKKEKYTTPLKGQSLELSLNYPPFKHIIRGLGIYIIPMPNNKVWVGGTKEKDMGFDDAITEESQEFILQKAEKLAPVLAEAKIVKQWAGLRPYSNLGGPITGWDENIKNLYHLTGHAGIGLCLTPYTSNKVRDDFS